LEVLNALGINLGYLFVQIFNFLIMFVVLRAWAYRPIVRSLEKRRASIEQGLEDARVAAKARANAEIKAEEIINTAQEKAVMIVREATERAEAAGRDVLAAAEADTRKTHDTILAETERERNHMLSDVRSQIAALAMAATQKLIGESLDERRQHTLINEFFSGIKDGKVVVLEGADFKGASAEVTSALPLTESEQANVKQDVLAKVGSKATVAFRVDPSILGGLVIRVGDKVLDNSVAGQLGELRQNLS
jgi:F-type H+-transporting ATPase subunit b